MRRHATCGRTETRSQHKYYTCADRGPTYAVIVCESRTFVCSARILSHPVLPSSCHGMRDAQLENRVALGFSRHTGRWIVNVCVCECAGELSGSCCCRCCRCSTNSNYIPIPRMPARLFVCALAFRALSCDHLCEIHVRWDGAIQNETKQLSRKRNMWGTTAAAERYVYPFEYVVVVLWESFCDCMFVWDSVLYTRCCRDCIVAVVDI